MRQCKMQIATQTDNQNEKKEMLQPMKTNSKKNGLKILKTLNSTFYAK